MTSIHGKFQMNNNGVDIAKLLRALPDEFVVKDVKKEHKAAWAQVTEEAKTLVPVDTGLLKEMIVQKDGYDKRNGVVFSVTGLRKIREHERQQIRARILKRSLGGGGSYKAVDALYDAYYGVFVEFGTRLQQAQPFIRPAFDRKKESVIDDYGTHLKDRLEARVESLKKAQ